MFLQIERPQAAQGKLDRMRVGLRLPIETAQ